MSSSIILFSNTFEMGDQSVCILVPHDTFDIVYSGDMFDIVS